MTHVLIIITVVYGGAAVSTQEFSDAQRCTAAVTLILEQRKAWGLRDFVLPICVPK
jgi:hypothetical protein